MTWIQKGDTIRAEWFEPYIAGIAGVQSKTTAHLMTISGEVRHVRGNHPTQPTAIGLFVRAESGKWCERCGCYEVLVRPEHVVEVEHGPRTEEADGV